MTDLSRVVALMTAAVLIHPASVRADQPVAEVADPRHIQAGRPIPDEGYCDQPYVVITDDGQWLCVLTTGRGVEGETGQHIVATCSADQGRTWSPLVPIEPADGPEASWAMPLKVPGGRVYVFYTYNADNLRVVPAGTPSQSTAASIRWGNIASSIPTTAAARGRAVRRSPCRRGWTARTTCADELMFFWGVGKPITVGDDAIFGFAKVGKWGTPGAMVRSQGAFLRGDNILRERDPADPLGAAARR